MLKRWSQPFPLHQDAPFLQNSPDFVDEYLDADQKATVISPCGDVKLHPVLGESGEGERAVRAHIEARAIKGLDDPAAKSPASVWAFFFFWNLLIRLKKQGTFSFLLMC